MTTAAGAGARAGAAAATAPRPSPRGATERATCLRRARDFIDQGFAQPLDLAQMAAAAGFSRTHFAHAFKAAYGESPAAYLTRRRVERAKDLLRISNLTVTEVSMLVGFSSLGSFSSRFSALVGLSPSAYQRHHAALGGPPPVPGCFLMEWSRPRGRDAVGTSSGTAGEPHSADSATWEKPRARR